MGKIENNTSLKERILQENQNSRGMRSRDAVSLIHQTS